MTSWFETVVSEDRTLVDLTPVTSKLGNIEKCLKI